MLVTLDGIDNEVSAVALVNAHSPILVTEFGMAILVNAVAPMKSELSIKVN